MVESWSWETFLDNLRWVAELRYGKPFRAQVRNEDAKVAAAHAALKG